MKSDPKPSPQPRKRHIPERLKLNDASCHPGQELLDRLAVRRPDPEALAIQAAWQFRFPVRAATEKELKQWS